MSTKRIVIVGAGGFAREVHWLIRDLNEAGAAFEFVGFVLSDLDLVGETDSKDEIVGDFSWLAANRRTVDCAAVGVGSPQVRLRLAQDLAGLLPGLEFPALIHPTVIMDRASTSVGQGVLLCAGTIATVNVKLRDFCMVNLACTLGHEAEIGPGTVLNPSVNISGGVTIGSHVLVGTGSQVLQNLTIGDGATVGAGALVNRDVEAQSTVVGVPARPIGKS